MKKIYSVLILICISIGSFSQKITIDSLAFYNGKKITVCAMFTGFHQTNGEHKVTYLNFDKPYPNQTFTVVIFEADIAKFNTNLADYYKNKKVCITGKVSTYKGKPQIVITSEEQLEFE